MELLQSRRNGRQKQNRTITTLIPRKVFKNATFSVKVFVLIWSNDNFVAATLFGAKIWIFTSKLRLQNETQYFHTHEIIYFMFIFVKTREWCWIMFGEIVICSGLKSWNWRVRFILLHWSNGQVSETFFENYHSCLFLGKNL